ncbi:hypothetical protein Cmtc_17560 [Cupriavidus sp. TKC]|uniref:bestrophin-like domain n=1 Tax=Cupriavidus sp. TKC TaxID=2880159 RepID=UPI0025A8AD64|nr:hypothetical protein [Cupriavidus sp. TKC]GMG90536.1 hypothetical protein Cmtc_17560 [Cupriavidus sp. TKC]
MIWLVDHLAHHSNASIMAAMVLSFAGLALLLAWTTSWYLERTGHTNARNSLGDVVHGSLLAFIVFVLAHVLNDTRANQGEALDLALREAHAIGRLNREFQALNSPEALRAQQTLKAYVDAVVEKDWPALGDHDPSLSPEADDALMKLVSETLTLAMNSPAYGSFLRSSVQDLETLRLSRLESATQTVPDLFWWVLTIFIVGAMIMNGRFERSAASYVVIAFHLGAIGMVVALVIILDEPYRGQTSISPEPLVHALQPRPT